MFTNGKMPAVLEPVNSGPARLRELRQSAMARFADAGFPTTRHEDWRFTDVSPIARLKFVPSPLMGEGWVGGGAVDKFHIPGVQGDRLVFFNGQYMASASSVRVRANGVNMQSVSEAIRSGSEIFSAYLGKLAKIEGGGFAAWNTAHFTDGAFIHVPDGKIVEQPIHLVFMASSGVAATAIHPRILIVADAESRVTVVEHYVSLDDGVSLTNAVTEILVGRDAVVEHVKFQNEHLHAYHVATIQAHLERRSRLISHSISLGANIARNDINAVLAAEGADCVLNGLYIAGGQQLVDHHTLIDHASPHCTSHEWYHGILDGRARGVFNGKIYVKPHAQKTDAKQTNRALLLSDDARIDTKPQLEIFADDVKCTHGATVGQLDEEAVFYLRSRGIGLAKARHMLTLAFAADIINRISHEPLREYFAARVREEIDALGRALHNIKEVFR